MIALIAAFGMQSTGIVEWLDPTWNYVSVQAVVKVPPLTANEHNLLTQIVSTLDESATYRAVQVADVAARTGSRLRANLMPDHIRIGMEVVPADTAIGVSMVASVLREPVVAPERIDAAGQDLRFRRSGYWRQALGPSTFEPARYLPRDVSELMERVFRPDNVTLAVGGNLTPGVASAKWDEIRAAWTVRKLEPDRKLIQKPRQAAAINATLSVIELAGEPFSATDAAFATRLLALTALGTGKAASLWKVARDGLGVSYRQEAVLSPTPFGFEPRLMVAHAGDGNLEELGTKIREGLISEIAAWTDIDRKRALGMAESFLVRGGDLNPLYFASGRPAGADLADQTFLQAYWLMKTGTRWNPHGLVGRMGFVELADLKSTAEKMFSSARLLIHKGRD